MAGPTDYDDLPERYGAGIDERPWNALYERPSTLALLPAVDGKDVLDAGCGPGWYTAWLADHGARVVGVDRSVRMTELARARLGVRARIIRADVGDLRDALPEAASFDLVVSSLVLHYVPDLLRTFREWARLLRPRGTVVFSTHHPINEKCLVQPGYLCTSVVEEEWRWLATKVSYYQRPLRDLTEPLTEAGFVIERISEPDPSDALRQRDPDGYHRLAKTPAFLFIRARKDT